MTGDGLCYGSADADAALVAAAKIWANESGCECIDIYDDTQFVRLWGLCIFAAMVFCTAVTAPFCPRSIFRCCCRRRRKTAPDPDGEAQDGEEKAPEAEKADEEAQDAQVKQSSNWWEDPSDDGDENPEPDIKKAERHLISSSATKAGQWRPLWNTTMSDFSEVGGAGTALYFLLLRSLGIAFAYMTAVSCASIAFNALSSFAPDNGNVLARTTIGNIGSNVKGIDLPPDQRYIIMKDEEGDCQGTMVTEMTKYLGWLDFCSTIIFLVAIIVFRFIVIPKVAQETDDNEITPKDYAVEIDNLPRNFEGMEEADSDDRNAYERELSELLCRRLTAIRKKERKKAGAAGADLAEESTPVKVEEMVLVRDFKERLHTVKQTAHLRREKDIAEYSKNMKAVEKLDKKIEKADAKLKQHLKAEDELDVVRAYAILSASSDVERLETDFRFMTYGILRLISECLGRCGHCERCCPQRKRHFRGKAIRIRRAPEPSNIIWENQDVPNWKRKSRQGLVCVVFLFIVILSFLLVFGANTAAKKSTQSTSQLLGNEECDPDTSRLVSADGNDAYKCMVNNATNWTLDFVLNNATSDEKGCYCGAVGYATIAQTPLLLNTVCRDWLVALGTGIGLGVLATGIVIGINVVCKTVLLMLAEQEKPLSMSALNAAKMVKIFALQTLNTGFVVFCVNFSPPAGMPFGDIIFVGEFKDSVRGWYVVVGAAILSNMLANAVTPAVTNIALMITAKIMRRCCRSRKKHQARLIQLYTNPEFDMAARFAQLLNTVFVTMTYSAGLPMLNFFACLYMLFTYWADKIILFRGSHRPPAFDTQIAKDATSIMLYAVPLHCMFAIWMFGQPCTFPSSPLGGTLASLAAQGNAAAGTSAGHTDGLSERVSKEATWMMFVLLVVFIVMYVLWCVLWILGGTVGEFFKCILELMCSRGVKVRPSQSEAPHGDPAWPEAAVHIEATCPPASYKMTKHPAFKTLGVYMAADETFAASRTSTWKNNRGSSSDGSPTPGGRSSQGTDDGGSEAAPATASVHESGGRASPSPEPEQPPEPSVEAVEDADGA